MSSRSEGTIKEENREMDSSDEETPINPEVRILSRIFGVHRASVASVPGTSGAAHLPTATASTRRTPRQERDRMFWTMLGNASRSPSTRLRSSTGARIPRPSTYAELLEPERRTATAPPPRASRAASTGYRPSASYANFHATLRNMMRRRAHDRAPAYTSGNVPGPHPSTGRQVFVLRARDRSEHGASSSAETSLDDPMVNASTEETAPPDDRSADAADCGDSTLPASEPLNMSTGALALEEEILELEPAAAAEPAQPDQQAENLRNLIDASKEAEPQAQRNKRKKEGDTHQSVSALNQSILRLLECPVCMEWMEPPISQCRRGHLVCGACRKRLETCPVCRTPFSSVRNRAMEDVASILRYPCRHGCGRQVRAARRHKHEASCAARRHACPLPPCRSTPPMPRAKLAQHCQSKHPSMFKTGPVHRLSLAANCEQHVEWVVSALGALFHVRVDMDVRAWGVLALVAHLGPVNQAPLYTYEIAVTGRHNGRRLVYSRTTHSDLESPALNTSRQDCFHLTLDQALNYLRFKNEHRTEQDKTLDLTITLAEAAAEEESVADSG